MNKATKRTSRKTKPARIKYDLPLLLESVLTQPTAPFRESWVKRAIMTFCNESRVPVYEDETGNLWAGARTRKEAQNASLVFVAHMDHPGMVITGFRQRAGHIFAKAKWLGAGPMDIRNFDVKVFSDVNALTVFDGVVRSHTTGPRGADDVEIEIKPSELARAAATERGLKALGPWGACLWYHRQGVPTGVLKTKDLWITKAADDLVGACAILDGYVRAGRPRGVVTLLTRAEESGFHGTLAVLKKKMLDPEKTLMISVETSAQLPGAELGKGPVVRLGDRSTIFNPAFVYWTQLRAAELAARDKAFHYQRRVMDGGTCEASAFNMYGFQVAGISTPLKNYHNIPPYSPRPEPEAVSVSDVEGLARLSAHLMKSHRSTDARTLESKVFKNYVALLLKNQREHEKYFKGF